MNTQFSRPRNDHYFNSYDPAWSNQSNISWQVQTPENYAPQFHELYHQVEPSPQLDSDFQDQMLKFRATWQYHSRRDSNMNSFEVLEDKF